MNTLYVCMCVCVVHCHVWEKKTHWWGSAGGQTCYQSGVESMKTHWWGSAGGQTCYQSGVESMKTHWWGSAGQTCYQSGVGNILPFSLNSAKYILLHQVMCSPILPHRHGFHMYETGSLSVYFLHAAVLLWMLGDYCCTDTGKLQYVIFCMQNVHGFYIFFISVNLCLFNIYYRADCRFAPS